jgi:plasmid stabilization system protein ParE
MKVFITPDARGSIDAIYGYIALDRPEQAQRVRDRILAAAQSRSVLPHRGRPGQVEDTRELLVKRLPYTIVYTVVGDTVYILGVYHQPTNR